MHLTYAPEMEKVGFLIKDQYKNNWTKNYMIWPIEEALKSWGEVLKQSSSELVKNNWSILRGQYQKIIIMKLAGMVARWSCPLARLPDMARCSCKYMRNYLLILLSTKVVLVQATLHSQWNWSKTSLYVDLIHLISLYNWYRKFWFWACQADL